MPKDGGRPAAGAGSGRGKGQGKGGGKPERRPIDGAKVPTEDP